MRTPWTVAPASSAWLIQAGETSAIVDACAGSGSAAEAEQTARLMAAAPDLLLALQLILENPDHELLPSERADAEAAMRTALGTAGKP